MSKADRFSPVHVFCSCGAAWHGKYAIANPVILRHRRDHALLDHEAYRAQFHCGCGECITVRRKARQLRRAGKATGGA